LRGTTLLEVVAALAILAIAGSGFIELAVQRLQLVHALHEREARIREAENVLARTAAWPAEELRARMGITTMGGHRVQIGLIGPSLYGITVLDGARSSALLSTSRYAPENMADAR
jgi:prepilin-type N-terminal cleavage/methylation domain-containing protein